MYIFGTYEVIQQQDQISNRTVQVFSPDARVEYEAAPVVLFSKLTALAKSDCDTEISLIADTITDEQRQNIIAAWGSHAKTIMANNGSNHQQIAAPNGHIYWWLKLV